MVSTRLTSRDLALMPDDGKRYEIIDGDLLVTHAPHFNHQVLSDRLVAVINFWEMTANTGIAVSAVGIIFSDDDDVIPDAVWISKERRAVLTYDGKIHGAPELVIEVLSFGSGSEERDRETKRKLYSRRGVQEYWIANWQTHEIAVYRRDPTAHALVLVETLLEQDSLTTPLLPGFAAALAPLFAGLTI